MYLHIYIYIYIYKASIVGHSEAEIDDTQLGLFEGFNKILKGKRVRVIRRWRSPEYASTQGLPRAGNMISIYNPFRWRRWSPHTHARSEGGPP